MSGRYDPRKLRRVDLVCSVCGRRETIQRYKRLHLEGHVKHLWCVGCREETAHIETRKPKLMADAN